MPDIIDNVKVGEYIKRLLKKKGMTQDALADALSISKSAVSQNLRGKSSFDIQNLMNIAKLFEITLDDLLNLKTEETSEVITEYEKLVNLGLSSIQKVNAQDLRISEPDLYGKVLVDYIINQRKLDMMLYLDQARIELVPNYYHRAPDVYLRLIKYYLEENQKDIMKFIIKYTELQGSFQIEDETMSFIIWGLLNKESNQDVVYDLMSYKSPSKNKFLSFLNTDKEHIPLTRQDYIEVISKFQLKHILKTYLITQNRDDDFVNIINRFIEHQFYEGIMMYIHHFYTKPIGWVKKVSLDVQGAMLSILDTNEFDLVIEFAKLGLYTDMTIVVKKAISKEQEKIYSHLIANYHDQIVFKKIAVTCVEVSNTVLLEDISHYLVQDDLNYLLSWTKLDDMKTMIYLLSKGARVDEKYYNLDTFKKINTLISHLLSKGE
ncbi:MAG: helix-turn-helix transcriptional regulator [Firmicutes bacterium]|nr:helix-turn-helix transcriptional regulator [Bacillota bacterium]